MLQPTIPLIVKVVEEPGIRETGVVDVLMGAIGLTGVMSLAAVLLGVLCGGLLILWVRYLRPRWTSTEPSASDRTVSGSRKLRVSYGASLSFGGYALSFGVLRARS